MLKKIILAALVVASAVFAQNVKIGAHAAGSFGTAWGDNTDMLEIGWGPGFNVGADAKLVINPQFSLVGGIGVDYRRIFWDVGGMMKNQMRKTMNMAGLDFDTFYDSFYNSLSTEKKLMMNALFEAEMTFSLLYVDIPVVARINPIPNFFIDAGIDLGINVSASVTTKSIGVENTDDIESDMKSTIDFGFVVGLGYSVTDKIDINFRTAIGLTDMVDMQKAFKEVSANDNYSDYDDEDDDDDDTPTFGFKNLRFHLGATFWFM